MEETKEAYMHIIDEVIKKSKTLFGEEGFDTSVLETLSSLWIQKLHASLNADSANINSFDKTDVSSETIQSTMLQVDGTNSSEDSDEDFDIESLNDKYTDDEIDDENSNNESDVIPNSDDDITDNEDDVTSNIILCQFDNIKKVRNLWKMALLSGVMNIQGKELVFNRAHGEAKW